MTLLINLATLKKGGGQNVGLNFLNYLISRNSNLDEYHFVVASGSEIENFIKQKDIKNYTIVSANPIRRILYEVLKGRKLIHDKKIDVIYTIFGIGLYPKAVKQISGSADSNIFFPEINFWEQHNGFVRFKKWCIDKFRIYALKRATAVTFENKSMLKRSIDLYHLKNTKLIKPSIWTPAEKEKLNFEIPKYSKVGLFFCGWQKNKNYEIIPLLAKEFKNRKIDFHFIITAPKDNSKNYHDFKLKLADYRVTEMVSIVGPICKNQIPSLYEKTDFVFLLSKLESFSNNIIEAWFFKKPLIISNEEWAFAICEDAAVYVSRIDAMNIVDTTEELISDYNKIKELVFKGVRELASYPTIDQKTEQELAYVREIYETH